MVALSGSTFGSRGHDSLPSCASALTWDVGKFRSALPELLLSESVVGPLLDPVRIEFGEI